MKASSVRLIPANAWSKTYAGYHALFGPLSRGRFQVGFMLRLLQLGLVRPAGSRPRLQKFGDALLQRREIVRDAPGHLLSVGGEFDAADQLRRGLELDVNIRREVSLSAFCMRRVLAPAADRNALRASVPRTVW